MVVRYPGFTVMVGPGCGRTVIANVCCLLRIAEFVVTGLEVGRGVGIWGFGLYFLGFGVSVGGFGGCVGVFGGTMGIFLVGFALA